MFKMTNTTGPSAAPKREPNGGGSQKTRRNVGPARTAIERTGAAVESALRVLPAAGEPGYPSPGDIAAGLAAALRARLGPSERLTMASAAVLSLDGEQAEMLAEATLHDVRAGPPVPPSQGLRDEARRWAGVASQSELRAYMAACWHRLSEAERAGFVRAARPAKRRAAA